MKNLNECGVQEMNAVEMRKVDGGGIIIKLKGATKSIFDSNYSKGSRWGWQRNS